MKVHGYYVSTAEHTVESIHEAMLAAQLDRLWVRVAPSRARRANAGLWRIDLYDLQTGAPILAELLGPQLSQEGRTALLAMGDEQDLSAAYELAKDGKAIGGWAGELASFSTEDPEGRTREGRAAFEAEFKRQTGVAWSELGAEEELPSAADLADEHTVALVRGRVVKLPAGFLRQGSLFRFHYPADLATPSALALMQLEALAEQDEEEDEEGGEGDEGAELDDDGQDDDGDDQDNDDGEPEDDDAEQEDEERLALVALDLKETQSLWKGTHAARVHQFLKIIERIKGAILGPLGHALPEVTEMVETAPPDRPLSSTRPHLILYETLAMATALAYGAGDRRSYVDHHLLPLLNLNDAPLAERAIRESLEEIEDLGVLSAMVEVLPYSAPEGELLESFADEEIRPLAEWAAGDDHYEGTIFLLDPGRLERAVAAFNLERFLARVDEFLRTWHRLGGGEMPYETWLAQRHVRDRAERRIFLARLAELKQLLAVTRENELSLGLLFYA
ncbi:MAG: hypothetical protein IT371_10860 [Deltaproteobacteria bacterium]|nr:hypothetical protein [Deltaproteobacteria bacterium]